MRFVVVDGETKLHPLDGVCPYTFRAEGDFEQLKLTYVHPLLEYGWLDGGHHHDLYPHWAHRAEKESEKDDRRRLANLRRVQPSGGG